MPSAKIDGRGWTSCQAVLPRAGPLPRVQPSANNYCCCVIGFAEGLALGKESLPRAVLCRGSGPRQRLFAECPSIFPRQILRPSAKMLCPVVTPRCSYSYVYNVYLQIQDVYGQQSVCRLSIRLYQTIQGSMYAKYACIYRIHDYTYFVYYCNSIIIIYQKNGFF